MLGRHLHAITDGETGERSQWIGWQIGKLTALDGVEMAGTHGLADADNPEYTAFPALAVEASLTAIPERALGYADAAEASYAVFRRLRDEGVIADAIAAEVEAIAGVVDPADLTLQYDVAVEIGALTGNLPAAGKLGEKAFVLETLRDAFARTPSGGRLGLHLCYGDYKHRHFTVPQNLALCVELANAVADAVDFAHMPVDRETGVDSAYFEPLRDLRAPGLALGVVDYEGDEQRTRELAEAATAGSGGMEFAVATECGMARIDERRADAPTLEDLLALHAMIAAPVR